MKLNRRTFFQDCAVGAAASMLPVPALPQARAAQQDRGASMFRFLFLDDAHIDTMRGLELRGHPAKRYPGNPLFSRKFPWEKTRVQLYGHDVVYNPERKLYQMYYISQPNPLHYPNVLVNGVKKVGFVTLPSYAESADGVNWERPLRKDVSFEGIAETNLIDMNFGQSFEPSVYWDRHDADPSRRYKAFIWDQRYHLPYAGKLDYRRTEPLPGFPKGVTVNQIILDANGKVIYEEPYNDYGMMVAFSADGLRWKKHPGWVFRCYSDTGQSVLYDEAAGKYYGYGRFNQIQTLARLYHTGESAEGAAEKQKDLSAFYIGRNVARVESTDFVHWSEPELVLAGDSEDPESFQINSMPVDQYEGVYIGIMEVDVRPFPNPGRPIQLATSRDGRNWKRVANRCAFIEEATPGAWDADRATGAGLVRPAAGLFVHGDEVRMYYCNESGPEMFYGVGMATWRRDGFVSLHAGSESGELVTRAFIPTSPELHLNIDASQGEATVRVCDFQGQPLKGWKIDQPSMPIRGNGTDTVVHWPDSDFSRRVGKATTLRITLRNADLYSYWT